MGYYATWQGAVVDRDLRLARASSFGQVAEAYERSRPGYPSDAVAWLVGDAPCDVVDVGAGTGKLTHSLVALGHRVTAVDPSHEMLGRLRTTVPQATALLGSAEALPLTDASADVVTAAQAFHWFDHGLALVEIMRVLRPGGRIALVWNVRDERDPWVRELSVIIGAEQVTTDETSAPLEASGLFGPVEHTSFEFAQKLDLPSLRDVVSSRSYCATRTDDERASVLAAVDSLFTRHAVGAKVTLPYVTHCFRAART